MPQDMTQRSRLGLRSQIASIEKWPESVRLAIVLLVALGLRVVNLTHEAAWYDEIITLQFLQSGTLSEFLARCQDLTPVPPLNLYQITEYYWGKYVHDSVLSQRVLSILVAMGGLVALYGFTRSLLNTRAAELTVCWIAFIPWHIYVSQEIRFYSLTTLLTILSMWTFTRMAASASPRYLLLNGAFNWLLCRTHPFAIFLCAAQGLFLLIFRPKRLRLIGWWSAIHAALAVSLALFLTGQNRSKIDALQGWIPKPGLRGYHSSIESFLKATGGLWDVNRVREFVPFTSWGQTLDPARPVLQTLLAAVTLLAGGLALWKLVRAPNDTSIKDPNDAWPLRGTEKAAILTLWFLVPPLSMLAASFLWRPIFVERYLTYAMLPIYIAVGHGLACQRSPLIRAAALAVPFALYFAFYFPGPSRTPYDKIVAAIRENSGEGPVILTRAETSVLALQFYWPDDTPEILYPPASADIISGKTPAPKECWMVLAPHHVEAFAATLKDRGEVFGPWEFPSARPVSLLRWLPAAQTPTPK